MKRTFFLLFFTTIVVCNAQVSDLVSLASGTMEIFSPIFDGEKNIYGYFSLYKKERVNKKQDKYEYVLLDKNLNKVANGDFIDKHYKHFEAQFFIPEMVENELLISKVYTNTMKTMFYTSSRLLNLETNTISEPFYVYEETLSKGYLPDENFKKKMRNQKFVPIPISLNDGFLFIESNVKQENGNPTKIKFYDTDFNKKWGYDFGKEDRNTKIKYEFLNLKDNSVFFYKQYIGFKEGNLEIHKINTSTGEREFSYEIEGKDSNYSHNFTLKHFDDRIVICGKISPYRRGGYSLERSVGFFKIILDNNGNELFKKYFLWEEANKFLNIDERGKLEKGYKLLTKSYFVFHDERIVVLTEKTKRNYNLLYGAEISKSTDFILLEFDENFNFENAQTIEKEKSKFITSDFLFDQYLNDGRDGVFFYRNYQKDITSKDKNWILGIVSLVDGKVNHEKLPISSDDFFITPYIAKEGYILLREFNKDSEFDEIRLEKLNLN
jgi:Family of unknown function (DUF6770)